MPVCDSWSTTWILGALYFGTWRIACRGQWQHWSGTIASCLCTVRTILTCCLTWVDSSAGSCPNVAPVSKSSPIEMACGTCRMRYDALGADNRNKMCAFFMLVYNQSIFSEWQTIFVFPRGCNIQQWYFHLKLTIQSLISTLFRKVADLVGMLFCHSSLPIIICCLSYLITCKNLYYKSEVPWKYTNLQCWSIIYRLMYFAVKFLFTTISSIQLRLSQINYTIIFL